MAAWLRQAVAAPEGAGRDRAAGLLRQAAGWYLAGSPARPVRCWRWSLGSLGVLGGLGAAGLPGAPPVLRGAVGGGGGRYEAAYEAVREVARGVALPRAAVRALVGELAGLAGGGEVAEYCRRCWATRRSCGCWAASGRACPGRGGAELTVLVNDLLVAASLVPAGAAGGEARGGGAGQREPAGGACCGRSARRWRTGRDPLGVLAGTGYRADEPLGVRLARLALLNLTEPARRRWRVTRCSAGCWAVRCWVRRCSRRAGRRSSSSLTPGWSRRWIRCCGAGADDRRAAGGGP